MARTNWKEMAERLQAERDANANWQAIADREAAVVGELREDLRNTKAEHGQIMERAVLALSQARDQAADKLAEVSEENRALTRKLKAVRKTLAIEWDLYEWDE